MSLPLSVLSLKLRTARQQHEAVETVLAHGGRVYYDWETDPFFPPRQDLPPKWLRDLLGADFFHDVIIVDLCNSDAHDADLACLEKLTKIRALWLENTSVTDAGLVHLSVVGHLEELSVARTTITDKGLVHLRGLTELRVLYGNSHVTAQGLSELEQVLPDCNVWAGEWVGETAGDRDASGESRDSGSGGHS